MAERLAQRLPVAGAMALLLSISCLLACTEATETQVTGTPTLEILEVRRMDTLLPGSSIRVRGRGVIEDDHPIWFQRLRGQRIECRSEKPFPVVDWDHGDDACQFVHVASASSVIIVSQLWG